MLLSIILVQSVGCDDVLESGVKEDRCKVCNGDGTSCKTVSGNVQNPCVGKYGQKLNTDNAHNTAINQSAASYVNLRGKLHGYSKNSNIRLCLIAHGFFVCF